MQNTFKGQTAGGLLKSAAIIETLAGTVEVVVKDRDGKEYQAQLGERPNFGGDTIRDVLVLRTFDGIAALLTTSTSACKKLVELNSKASKAAKAMQD